MNTLDTASVIELDLRLGNIEIDRAPTTSSSGKRPIDCPQRLEMSFEFGTLPLDLSGENSVCFFVGQSRSGTHHSFVEFRPRHFAFARHFHLATQT